MNHFVQRDVDAVERDTKRQRERERTRKRKRTTERERERDIAVEGSDAPLWHIWQRQLTGCGCRICRCGCIKKRGWLRSRTNHPTGMEVEVEVVVEEEDEVEEERGGEGG